jgi:uncharacterized membrane protein
MAMDTFLVYCGIYNNVGEALMDYEVVKGVHDAAGLIQTLDAAVVERKEDGSVEIVKKHETPTRAGGILGGGFGLATGLVLALFPAVTLGGGLLAATTGGGAVLGAIAGHAAGGMSRKDLKELGEQLDEGQAGLVVVAIAQIQEQLEHAMPHARRVEARNMQADTERLEADAAKAST